MPWADYKDHAGLTLACLALASSVYILASSRHAAQATSTDPSTDSRSITNSVLRGRRLRKIATSPVEEAKDVTPVDPKRPWKRIVQVWSESLRTWETRIETEDSKTSAGELFVVNERKPREPEDRVEILLQVCSPQLACVLRHILRDSDAVCEDDPTVNAREIYVGRDTLREIMRYLQAYLSLPNHGDGAMGPISGGPEPSRYEEADDRNAYAGLFPPPPTHAAEEKHLSELMALVLESIGKTSSPASYMPAATLESSVDSFVKEAEPNVGPSHAERYEAVKKMNDHLVHLLTWLDEEFRAVDQKLGRLLPTRISYNLLWTVLYEGALAKVTHETSGEPQGIVVTQTWYGKSHADGPYFGLRGYYMAQDGSGFVKMSYDTRIHEFKGVRDLSSLDARPLAPREKTKLKARGKLANQLVGVHHKSYAGNLFRIEGWGFGRHIVRRKADGRTIVDAKSFLRMNPSNEITLELCWSSASNKQKAIIDDDVWLLPPTVLGFSLALKEWGEFLVGDGFTEIDFNVHAYDHLVLEPATKELVRALVDQSQSKKDDGIQDVIAGKGGGLICVLHGRPGTGKTLTAEAVAERLKRPLFIVSSSSLGLSACQVEENLQDSLELAHIWDAVMLIDEADVFLEARGEHETARNALVSVFLRLLEYQNSVLFLTTNRVRCFDEAFISRFNVCIRYPKLDAEKRAVIWRKFLQKAQLGGSTPSSEGAAIEGSPTSDGGDKGKTASPLPLQVVKLDQPPFRKAKDSDDKVDVVEEKDADVRSTGSSSTAVSGTATPIRADAEGVEKKAVFEVDDALIEELARKPLNGRSIKNHIRTAQALANAANETLSGHHLRKVLKTAEQFQKDIKELAMIGDYEEDEHGFTERFKMFN